MPFLRLESKDNNETDIRLDQDVKNLRLWFGNSNYRFYSIDFAIDGEPFLSKVTEKKGSRRRVTVIEEVDLEAGGRVVGQIRTRS